MKKNRFFARNKDVDVTRLRCMLGMLGLLLPWIVLILHEAFGFGFPDSISATYYKPETIVTFMIILGAAGLFLIAYRGYELIDDILNTVAGIAGLCICFFPCDMYGNETPVGTFQLPSVASGIVHNISAIVFFALLSINSLFLFTKSNGVMTENKKKRNVIFRICGIGMIAAFIPMPFALTGIWSFKGLVWIVEAVALFFFGLSFVTKANVFKFLFAEDQKIKKEDKDIQKMENAKISSSNCTKD